MSAFKLHGLAALLADRLPFAGSVLPNACKLFNWASTAVRGNSSFHALSLIVHSPWALY